MMECTDSKASGRQPRRLPWASALGLDSACEVESTGSTNTDMKAAVRASASSVRALLSTRRQTAGRGTHGRQWAQPENGLFLTVALPADPTPAIALAVGLALARRFAREGRSVKVKWPNDLLMDDGKLAGILVEAVRNASGQPHLVIGVGVNLAWGEADRPTAVASLDEAGDLPREDWLRMTAEAVVEAVRGYDALAKASLAEAWRAYDALMDRRIRVDQANGVDAIEGVARGIAASGALLVRTADGRLVEVVSGSARLLCRGQI